MTPDPNHPNQGFWSYSRNRWKVLIIGSISIFCGYVIATPENLFVTSSGNVPKKVPVQERKIKALTTEVDSDPSTLVSDSPSMVAALDTPSLKTDPEKEKAKELLTSLDHTASAFDSFDPFTRDLSEKEQSALLKEVQRGPEDYPYEISDEELDLLDKETDQRATPQDRLRLLGYMGGYQPKKSDEKKSNKSSSALGDSGSNGDFNNRSNRSNSRSPSFYSNPDSTPDEDTEGSESEGNANGEFMKGTASESKDVAYQPGPKIVPPHLAYTHEALEVYNIVAGYNAGFVAKTLNINAVDIGNGTKEGKKHFQKNLYKEIKPKFNDSLHVTYSVPPDWDSHWFADDFKTGIQQAIAASNRHLITLGKGGSITFIVREGRIPNQNGVDFIIWSNPFCFVEDPTRKTEIEQGKAVRYDDYNPNSGKAIGGVEKNIKCNKKIAQVSVSSRLPGEGQWTPIEPCERNFDNGRSRCAGFGVNLWKQNPALLSSGGDKYDLDEVSLGSIRSIKIDDLGNEGEAFRGGFALDAIAMVHFEADPKKEDQEKRK